MRSKVASGEPEKPFKVHSVTKSTYGCKNVEAL